nr:tigger transposable element-derived protein 4-like [Parasteatoda tepidariorum]
MKKRAGLAYKTIKGNFNSVDLQEAEEWKAKLPGLISGYQPKDIFNMDECGLFFNLLPDKTYAFKGESSHGGKNSKERFIILVGASMNGIEKLPTLVIGKSKKTRCFQNVKSLPCDYDSNQKSWMTIAIFEGYLKKLDSKMWREKRNIIIFVDRAAHSKENNYTNIRLQFLPPNSSSVLQAIEQGVIKVFEQHYKMRLVKRMLEGLENTEESASIPVNGTLLIRGKEEKLNVDFTLSNGWIDRMKKRAGLVYKTIKGDCNNVDLQEAEE